MNIFAFGVLEPVSAPCLLLVSCFSALALNKGPHEATGISFTVGLSNWDLNVKSPGKPHPEIIVNLTDRRLKIELTNKAHQNSASNQLNVGAPVKWVRKNLFLTNGAGIVFQTWLYQGRLLCSVMSRRRPHLFNHFSYSLYQIKIN